MRAELAAFPDGRYEFEDFMEDDGIHDRRYPHPRRVHSREATRSSSISPAAITQATGARSTPRSASPGRRATTPCCTSPTRRIPKNSGCFRPIRVLAPPGTHRQRRLSRAGGRRQHRDPPAYRLHRDRRAGIAAVPDRAPATDAATHCNFLFGGTDPRTGDYYVCYDFLSAGWGGRPFADGNSAVNCINGNCRMIPVEVFEVRYPVAGRGVRPGARQRGRRQVPRRTRRHQARALSRCADHGEPHGRPAQVAALGPCTAGVEAALARLSFQRAGESGWHSAIEDCGKASPSKFAGVTINPGDRIWLTTTGGGGWGEPVRALARGGRRGRARGLGERRARRRGLRIRGAGLMRFAERGLYIERYVKCANCGILLYEEDQGQAIEQDDDTYCSDWCLAWARERAARAERAR